MLNSTEALSPGSEAPGPPGQSPEPINDNFFTRTLTLFVVNILRHKYMRSLYKSVNGVMLVSRFAIKTSACTTLAEAHAMRFVANNTSIPVPKVYCAFVHNDQVCIVMERVDGHSVARDWEWRPEWSRARILIQLKNMIQQLRDIPHPDAQYAVSNSIEGPIFDERLPGEMPKGPFPTVDDFHRELRQNFELDEVNMALFPEELVELVEFQKEPVPKTVFTHGALSSLNILVDGDEVAGIINWENAGWFPPYWEYITAWNVKPDSQFWQEEVDKFLTPMPHELKMDVVRRRYFGNF
ncbi:kinase-like protein [Hypoxylon argillaceum]|nr:kinase-like protein [Hypoxylon argillaceum]